MNAMFSFTLVLMVAGTLAAICAALMKARASPQLILASVKSPVPPPCAASPSPLVFEVAGTTYIESLCASRSSGWRPSLSFEGKSPPDSKKGRDRERRAQRASAPPSNGSGGGMPHEPITFGDDAVVDDGEVGDDMGGPTLARVRKPYRLRRRLYSELVQIFCTSGSRDEALILKVALNRRLPGEKKLIDAAFHEAARSTFYIA